MYSFWRETPKRCCANNLRSYSTCVIRCCARRAFAARQVASELLSPELAPAFRASFTSPFEVSNKRE